MNSTGLRNKQELETSSRGAVGVLGRLDPSPRWWLIVSALLGATAVLLGALGAHWLQPWLAGQVELAPQLAERRLENFKLGAHYQLLHALAILGTITLPPRTGSLYRWCWLGGSGLFCGSLYGYALTGGKIWVHVVPVGGIILILGWVILAWAAWRSPANSVPGG